MRVLKKTGRKTLNSSTKFHVTREKNGRVVKTKENNKAKKTSKKFMHFFNIANRNKQYLQKLISKKFEHRKINKKQLKQKLLSKFHKIKVSYKTGLISFK